MIPYMVGKLAPNLSHLTRGLVRYVPGRGYFRALSSQNGDQYVTSRPPQSLNRSFLASFVLLLYFFSRTFHAACPLPTPSSQVLPMYFFTKLGAERSVVKNKMPKRFSFARVHVATAGEFCAVVGFGTP